MKKFFMIAIMAVAALTASAQKGEIKFSAHAGAGYVNVSNMEFPSPISSDTHDFSNALGLVLGAECEYMVSDNFGLSAGLDYLYTKSDEVTEESIYGKVKDMHVSGSMLNIPVLAQYHMGKFAVKAGLQPGFTLSADLNNDGKSMTVDDENGKKLKDYTNSFNLSLPVGISYDCGSSTTLDLRCAIPLTKMNKEKQNKDYKMMTVLLTVGYRF